MSDDSWNLTESDPGVFTELLRSLQTPSLIVDDLYSLDPDSLAALQPLHALIFLFKHTAPSAQNTLPGTPSPPFPGYFAHQVVQNACATLAVLNALGNIPARQPPPDSPLAALFAFSADLDPHTRGLALASAPWLRAAHNALSPPQALSLDGLLPPGESEDAYHYVVYLPVDGALWELDGLKESPVSHGAFAGEWVGLAREVIEARIATYPAGALEFSLLALRDDPLPALRARTDPEAAIQLSNENAKRERWAFENALRRHNHLGLAHSLLTALARSGRLGRAVDDAREAARTRHAAQGVKA